MGNAISKVVIIAEGIKSRVPELHQHNEVYSEKLEAKKSAKPRKSRGFKQEEEDFVEPNIELSDGSEVRFVAGLKITLSLDALADDQVGY